MKGWELLKEIAEGNIKEGTRFKANCYTFIVKCGYLYKECNITREYADSYELMWDFELIEDNTIDIDNINLDKIIKVFEDIEMCLDRLSVKISSAGQGSIDNYLDRYKYDLQAVKQLNKEIKSIKEK